MTTIMDNPKMTGQVTFSRYNREGDLVEQRTISNLVVTAGLQHMVARLSDTSTPDQMSHMALGSSSTAPALSDAGLGAELGRTDLSVAGGTTSNNTVTYIATFGSGVAVGAITEAGVFNDSSSGTMLCRTSFPAINKESTDSLAVTWVITVS